MEWLVLLSYIALVVTNAVWFILYDKANNEWAELCDKMNEGWKDLCNRIVEDYRGLKDDFRSFGESKKGGDEWMDRVSKAEREFVRMMQKSTNADCIRAMTDEELAEFLTNNQKIGDVEQHKDGYFQLWLDWLKQEA